MIRKGRKGNIQERLKKDKRKTKEGTLLTSDQDRADDQMGYGTFAGQPLLLQVVVNLLSLYKAVYVCHSVLNILTRSKWIDALRSV